MIWNRERYIAHTLFEDTGREMFCELFGPLHALEPEWRAQGASEKEIGMTAFDWDWTPTCWLAGNAGAVTGIAPQILRDTPEELLAIDRMGRRTRMVKKSATIALPLDNPVAEPDDWLRVKHWYAFSENRVNREALREQKKAQERGALTLLGFPGAFDEPRELMGEAALCVACYEEPDMIHDMMETFADTAVKVIERVGETVSIDNIMIHEDMAGKSGPLFGPTQIREFFHPYYKKVWEAAKAYGAKIFSIDSDGDVSPILDELVEGGVNCIHPCEPAGGMDIVKLRRKYGKKLALKGGINKFALLGDRDAIRQELTYRLDEGLRHGGTFFGLDHRIPNGVTIENYRYYVSLGREMLGLPPIAGEGWGRMAF